MEITLREYFIEKVELKKPVTRRPLRFRDNDEDEEEIPATKSVKESPKETIKLIDSLRRDPTTKGMTKIDIDEFNIGKLIYYGYISSGDGIGAWIDAMTRVYLKTGSHIYNLSPKQSIGKSKGYHMYTTGFDPVAPEVQGMEINRNTQEAPELEEEEEPIRRQVENRPLDGFETLPDFETFTELLAVPPIRGEVNE